MMMMTLVLSLSVDMQVDIFAIEAVDIGEIQSMKITKNPGGPWHLKQLILKEEQYSPIETYFYLDE